MVCSTGSDCAGHLHCRVESCFHERSWRMNVAEIIAALKTRRDRVDSVIGILGETSVKGNGRRARRRLSAAAKRRISTAMKKNWAARKKSTAKK